MPRDGTNPDVGAMQWMGHGRFERRVRDAFDAHRYLANYADAHAATEHYLHFGHAEGRTDHLFA